jgi:hypothetical protein
MKKLFILCIAAVTLTAMSANVFAQGTGIAPEIGSSHDYWVNATENEGTITQASGNGNNYRWWVSQNTGDLTVAMTAGTEFSVASGTYAGTGGEDNFTIQLVWNPVSAGNTFYLVVEETDASGCINLKATPIQPVNAFDVIFAAINEADEDADNPERCAPDIALTANGTTITYDYGSDEYIYKITSTGLYSDWTFDYDFVNTLGVATSDIGYSTDGGATYSTGETSSGSKTVTPTSGAATVYFKVSVDNGDTEGTEEEGLSEQNMVLTLTNISDGTNAPANIFKADGVTAFGEEDDIEQTQTVKARPATSGIGYN